MASIRNLIIYLCQRRQSTQKTIKQEDCAIRRSPLLISHNLPRNDGLQNIPTNPTVKKPIYTDANSDVKKSSLKLKYI